MPEPKYYFVCRSCGSRTENFREWFNAGQKCHSCGNKWVDVKYNTDLEKIRDLVQDENNSASSVFHYFDFLPLDYRENIVTEGEGSIKVDRWPFLEKFARENYGLELEVLAYRNDENQGTGTFKDVAAAVAASVLKENGIKQYCVASTGNIANAFAHYLARAGISLAVFIPEDALKANEAGVSCYGQRVFRVLGDYAMAKRLCAEYSAKYGIHMSGGNIDPARVEAKKTQVFEWLRQIGTLPDVYVQALAGGTGPIAIDKGIRDIEPLGIVKKDPRYIMVQASGCDPMTAAWEKAKKNDFPGGWENDFPIYDNPVTKIPTLANGNPQTFPIIGSLCKKTGGEIITFNENLSTEVARLVAYETTIKIGPAATIAVGGFFEGLKKRLFREGEKVMLNIGEGVERSPELLEEMIYSTKFVSSVEECESVDREIFRDDLWKPFID
jgi:threonine synthase